MMSLETRVNRAGRASFLRLALKRMNEELKALIQKADKATLDESEFGPLLQEIGFEPGATILLHMSMDEISRRIPSMTPGKLINLAIELIGVEGTLLMPTIPFEGSQLDWLQTTKTFNVRRTPSRMGLVSEMFRRMPGVRRSLHPTHPVAGRGKLANELLSEHHLGPAFGKQSPYYKLGDCDGIAVVIGAPNTANTLVHVGEALHPLSSAHAYSESAYPMTVIDGERQFEYEVHPLRTDRPRNAERGLRTMIKEGIVRCQTRGGLKTATCEANKFIARSLELIDTNLYYKKPI